jgi:integrase/recombinase XerD
MKPTNFSKYIADFLSEYLPTLKNVSKNTISSYCDTFRIFLKYCRDYREISIEKLTLDDLEPSLIKDFLKWLETERNCSISTRNQRLGAIHSFMRYVQIESPENMFNCQRILDISFKKNVKPTVKYLSTEDMKIIFEQPDLTTIRGRRDLVLLCVLYDTGARVQEISDLIVRNIRLEHSARIHLTGKGRKSREVPILPQTIDLLQNYLLEHKLNTFDKLDYPVFFNRQKEKLSRAGISYILNKYVQNAKRKSSLVSAD